MRAIWTISLNTIREWLREKFFWFSVSLSFFLICLSLLLGEMTFSEEVKLLIDFGFLAIEYALVLMSAFAGGYVIAREVEKQTCLLSLSRPITRIHFLLGKVFGLFGLILILLLPITLVFIFLIPSNLSLIEFFKIVFSIYFKSLVLLCLGMMASMFISPIVSFFYVIFVYLIGHWIEDLKYFASKSGSGVYQNLASFLDYAFPQFYQFNWKSFVILEQGVSTQKLFAMIIHYTAWLLMSLIVANLLFRRKDIV